MNGQGSCDIHPHICRYGERYIYRYIYIDIYRYIYIYTQTYTHTMEYHLAIKINENFAICSLILMWSASNYVQPEIKKCVSFYCIQLVFQDLVLTC